MPRPELYDRRSTLRRGAGILLFFLALALLGPGLYGLAWDTATPVAVDKWLLVSSAAVYLAAAMTIIAWRVETPELVWSSRRRRGFESDLHSRSRFHFFSTR